MLRRESGQGKTPISKLFIVRHWNGSAGNVQDLIDGFNAVAAEEDNQNTFAHAKDKIGPRRGWFTRDAKIYILGCSADLLAGTVAEAALRASSTILVDDAMAFGNMHWLGAGLEDQVHQASVDVNNNQKGFPFDKTDPHTSSLDTLLGFDGWIGLSGGL